MQPNPAEVQDHGTMLKPSPIPGNANPKDANKYRSMAVEKECTVPSGFKTCRVPDALQQLFPDQFATVTSAKKVTRSSLRCHLQKFQMMLCLCLFVGPMMVFVSMQYGVATKTASSRITCGQIILNRPCFFRKGLVLINDDIVNTTTEVEPEQTVKLLTRIVPRAPLKASAAPKKLEVAYEDDHVAAVVKPQGIPTIHMGEKKAGQVAAAECIKYCITMPAIPGMLLHVSHQSSTVPISRVTPTKNKRLIRAGLTDAIQNS